MEKIRKHFYFSGRVQGVGFRYRSYYIAQSIGLTGWVRNLWDDRVEMEVQGTREEIREMVRRSGRGKKSEASIQKGFPGSLAALLLPFLLSTPLL